MLNQLIIIIVSAPTWYETFDLPDGLYNIPEIQDILNI